MTSFTIITLLLAVIIPFLSPRLREHHGLTGAVLIVVLLRQGASFYHVFVGNLPTVGTDSAGLDYFARLGQGRAFAEIPYVQFLSYAYQSFGYSHLLGCELSQVAFSLSIVVFLELIAALGLSHRAPILVIAFGLLPSCIVNTSVTMREAFQVLCFLVFVWALLKLRREEGNVVILFLLLAAWGLVNLHQGLALFVVLATPLGLVWATRSRPGMVVAFGAGTLILLGVFGHSLWATLLEKSTALEKVATGSAVEYADTYTEWVEESRTTFAVQLDLSSAGGAARTVPLVFVYYFFSPLPWQIHSLVDIVGFGEAALRLVLVTSFVLFLHRSRGEQRTDLTFLFVIFVLMEGLWAAGTANTGTAVRHRVVAYGLLLVLGANGWPGEWRRQGHPRNRQHLRQRFGRRNSRFSGKVRGQ